MTIYLAFIVYNYEGGRILGAFSTEEQALYALACSEYKGDSQEIREMEIDILTEFYI